MANIWLIAGFDSDFVRKVGQNYPGRASSSPTIDVFITLMQMGTSGYKQLMEERRENYKILKGEMAKVAEKYGERVLETKNNPISIGTFFYALYAILFTRLRAEFSPKIHIVF